ncbi:RlmE family RNA methyltransferase [Microbaculum sp. FT89]|uniref:RlmE family RNA methyltransferase n=1 Tax=Microbaculum sp. FT89 TaxID=3447298 RepID=UPI003F53817F
MTSKSGGRQDRLKVRVKTAKRRSTASTRWLQRQLNDPYVAKARSEGYRSRAAYKLAEIDDKYRFLKPGGRIVDLGAAPGGWSQVAAERVGSAEGKGQGKVVAIDILEMDPVPGVDVLHLDFLDDTAPERLREALGGPADVVLSDIAPPTTGHKQTDHLRIMGMCETALEFAREVLAPGGTFLAKVLRGGTEAQLLNDLKRDFDKVRHVKPPASRADSAELYVMATGFRGRDEAAGDER